MADKNKKGFSYLEILVCLGIISMTLVPLTMAFFHLSNTQVRTYQTYQQATLLHSLMVELAQHVASETPERFDQHDLDSFVANSDVNYRTDLFRYERLEFQWSEGFAGGERAYFYIRLESYGEFGSLQLFRYGLFEPTLEEDEEVDDLCPDEELVDACDIPTDDPNDKDDTNYNYNYNDTNHNDTPNGGEHD